MLLINESFKVTTYGINNNSVCNDMHSFKRFHNKEEIYKVKEIHYGGIYDGKEHIGTIETYCGCFIRYYKQHISKIF